MVDLSAGKRSTCRVTVSAAARACSLTRSWPGPLLMLLGLGGSLALEPAGHSGRAEPVQTAGVLSLPDPDFEPSATIELDLADRARMPRPLLWRFVVGCVDWRDCCSG